MPDVVHPSVMFKWQRIDKFKAEVDCCRRCCVQLECVYGHAVFALLRTVPYVGVIEEYRVSLRSICVLFAVCLDSVLRSGFLGLVDCWYSWRGFTLGCVAFPCFIGNYQ